MFSKMLIANRGEIAVRLVRGASSLGIQSVAVFSPEDARSLHVRKADLAVPLEGRGAAAYLDIGQIIAVAKRSGCEAIHPGYGFLSENAAFARACREAGIVFVGPRPELIELFGDKVRARALAREKGVPLPAGIDRAVSLEEAQAFLSSLGGGAAIMIKAVAGGGGRGMRAVHSACELPAAYARCRSEAQAAFGHPEVYVERLIRNARHVEVQIVGDGTGAVIDLGERECSIQRRHQKMIEIAPSPTLSDRMRDRLAEAARNMAGAARYDSLGTFEFLVEDGDKGSFAFLETNARLQVEHTVTEEVTGIDLVKTQIELAAGKTLADLRLKQNVKPRGYAIQLRINMETLKPDGNVQPSGGTLTHFDIPSGPGIRVDTFGYQGYTTTGSFDSLLAKVIARTPADRFDEAVARAYEALAEFRIGGVETNIGFLQNLLKHPDFVAGNVHTRFVEDHMAALVAGSSSHRKEYFETAPEGHDTGAANMNAVSQPPGSIAVSSPMQGRVVGLEVAEGVRVRAGDKIAVLEAMKMEHLVTAHASGIVVKVAVQPNDTVSAKQPLVFLQAMDVGEGEAVEQVAIDLDLIRPDLAEVIATHAVTLDAGRPDAVAKRRKAGQRMARENIDDLCDPGSFVEYGSLALAAQRKRRSEQELIDMSPADGVVVGLGAVNGELFGEEKSRCAVLAYDYTVFAGTQGFWGHKKHDRIFQVAEKAQLPVVIFAEGGGGRPGEVDAPAPVNLANMTFWNFAKLSGLAPLVGIVSGRCFAGNAALLGCCDVVIATENATIGMGGPAMIEGAGLGRFLPEEVGPVSVQEANGVIDIVVKDEAAAVQAAKKYLSYFQGPVADWSCQDQRHLRHLIPERRLRAYDVRQVIDILADTGSVLELRRGFGRALITALIRIEGRPMGLIANNPSHEGGAVAADEADKAARFIRLCDAFDLPILSLCDTPGFMVGPDSEKQAAVRRVSRMFVAGANIDVPFFTVVLRKAYGLGAMAMGGGGFHGNNYFTVAWPTGEIGAMGLEGAVQLAYRNELAAITDPAERDARYRTLVDELYERGKVTNIARFLSLDEVIDPLETRRWILRGLRSAPPVPPRSGKKRCMIDTW